MIKISKLHKVSSFLSACACYSDQWQVQSKEVRDSVIEFLEEIDRADQLCGKALYDGKFNSFEKGYVEIVPVLENSRNAGRKKKRFSEDSIYRAFCQGVKEGRAISAMAKECGVSISTAFRWKKRMLEE